MGPRDVTYHRPTIRELMQARLATWLANDMRSLTELVDEVDAETFATDGVFTAAQQLMQSLETAVAAARQQRPDTG